MGHRHCYFITLGMIFIALHNAFVYKLRRKGRLIAKAVLFLALYYYWILMWNKSKSF